MSLDAGRKSSRSTSKNGDVNATMVRRFSMFSVSLHVCLYVVGLFLKRTDCHYLPLAKLTICRREAATICPRPGLQVVTRYTSYTHLDPLLTRCPCWPASTANQSGLMTLTFDLESGVRVTCANFILPRPLCCRHRPDVRDRQTSNRQTSDRIIA